jgi:hypothetical protein
MNTYVVEVLHLTAEFQAALLRWEREPAVLIPSPAKNELTAIYKKLGKALKEMEP